MSEARATRGDEVDGGEDFVLCRGEVAVRLRRGGGGTPLARGARWRGRARCTWNGKLVAGV